MKYLIDLTMLYEVDTGMIMINGEEESSIKLSNQAGRLLYELIINNGKTLDRDDLIKKVWEDHGFSGSSVSLNVAISEIRKAFRTLGCDPLLIKTIRGKGFSLAAHIEHHTVRPPVISTLSEESASEAFDTLAHKKDADPPKQIISLHRLFISLCTLLLIIVTGTAVLLLHQRDSYAESLKDSDMHLLGKVDRCTIYLIDKNMYQPRQHYFNHVKEVIASQHIDCQHQVADAYYSVMTPTY